LPSKNPAIIAGTNFSLASQEKEFTLFINSFLS